jgi:hypothetical protein
MQYDTLITEMVIIQNILKKVLRLNSPQKKEEFHITEIIARAMKEASPTYPVPVIWDKVHFRRVIELL